MMIAICGIDGAGKTTQGKLLCNYLKNKGLKVIFIKQHTEEYYMNSELRNYLYDNKFRTAAKTQKMAMLSASDRLKQYNKEIRIKLEEDYIVIVDRYIYSAYAYSMARGLELRWLMEINRFVPVPDITIYIDVPALEAQKRIEKREKVTIEERNKIFLQHVRKNYLNQKWGKNNTYFIVNGVRTIKDVHSNILNIVNRYGQE